MALTLWGFFEVFLEKSIKKHPRISISNYCPVDVRIIPLSHTQPDSMTCCHGLLSLYCRFICSAKSNYKLSNLCVFVKFSTSSSNKLTSVPTILNFYFEFKDLRKYFAVIVSDFSYISCGVPVNTISPPFVPPSGPTSMI